MTGELPLPKHEPSVTAESAVAGDWVPYLELNEPPAPRMIGTHGAKQAATAPDRNSHKTYVVPRRFGLAAILAMNTLLSFLFGILAWHQAHPAVFVFFALLALVICLAQMRYGESPRLASTAAGAILVLVFVGVAAARGRELWVFALAALPMALAGAGLGYLAGTVAAGLFLLSDLFTAWWNNRNDAIKSAHRGGEFP